MLNYEVGSTLEYLIRRLNRKGIKKDDIISLGKDGGVFYAVYKDKARMKNE